ncbi:MAG: response regulator, partial [Chloroflexota bacterium]
MPDKAETLSILLVDDDEDEYILLNDMLHDVDGTYTLVWAPTYDSALERLTTEPFDVLLFDYHLGEHTGLDLLAEATVTDSGVPVILLTGLDDDDVGTEAIRAGATDYLRKAKLDNRLLERALRYAVERGRTLQKLRQSEAQYRAIVDGQTDMLIRFSPDFQLTFANRTTLDFFVAKENDLLGTHALAAVHASSKAMLENSLQGLSPDAPTITHELQMASTPHWM